MSELFIQPLGLLGLLGIPIIILIYLLKSKYVQKPVSSTFIWKRSLRYMKTRLPLNFTFSLLLILQILMVIFASLAISRPQIEPFTTKDTVIILDSSASMMTKNEDGKTRYELALEEIQKEADSAGDNKKYTLISAGNVAKLHTERSSSKAEIINALEDISCDDGAPDIDGALLLANGVQNINPEAKLYFYTDKEYFDASGVEVVDFSKDSDVNIAITNLTDTNVGGKYSFTATISNYGPQVDDVIVTFYVDSEMDGKDDLKLVSTQTYSFASNSKTYVTFAPRQAFVADGDLFFQIDSFEEYESIKVTIESDTDGLASDNERYLYSSSTEKVKILVVSENVKMEKDPETGETIVNQTYTTYIVAVLRTIGHSISNRTDIKNDINQVNNGKGIEGYDLYIFEGIMPPALPTDGAVWFINPKTNPVGTALQVSGKQEEAELGSPFYLEPTVDTKTDTYKTLTRNLGKRQIEVGTYRSVFANVAVNQTYEPVFACNNDTVIIAGRENNVRVVCVSMDFQKSRITMQIDFPLLINNMLTYSLPNTVEQRSFEVGQTVKFNAPVGGKQLSFKYGDNILDSAEAVDTEFKVDKLGIYAIDVEYDNGNTKSFKLPTSIPVDESDVSAGGDAIVSLDITTTEKPEEDPMEIWPYIVMLLLVLAIIEWGVYYRDEF